jgi:hypothetical protein
VQKVLVLVNFVLICFVSLYGIIDQSIYNARLNSISLPELLGEDISNFVFGAVGLVLVFTNRRLGVIARLVLLGLLTYFIYMYSYYSFSIVSSIFYIGYLAIFAISLFIFIFQVIEMTKTGLVANDKYPRKTIACFFFFVVLIMTVLELPDIFKKTILDHKTIILFQEYYVLDLTIVFPAIIIIAIMNLQKNRHACLWSGIVLIKIATIMPALLMNEIFYRIKNGAFLDFSFVIIASSFIIVAAIIFLLFIRGIDRYFVTQSEKMIA